MFIDKGQVSISSGSLSFRSGGVLNNFHLLRLVIWWQGWDPHSMESMVNPGVEQAPLLSTLYQGTGFKTQGHVLSRRIALSQRICALVLIDLTDNLFQPVH